MIKCCGSGNRKLGVTSFLGKLAKTWPKLNKCLGECRRNVKVVKKDNDRCVIVLGLMEDEFPIVETETPGGGEVHLAIEKRGIGTETERIQGIDKNFKNERDKFQGNLTAMNAIRMHCLLDVHNRATEKESERRTDVISVLSDEAEIKLRKDVKTPSTTAKNGAKHHHMVGKIEARFPVELHKNVGEKHVDAICVDHGSKTVRWTWSRSRFTKDFFEEVLPWCATANFLAAEGIIWLPFQPWFVDNIFGHEEM